MPAPDVATPAPEGGDPNGTTQSGDEPVSAASCGLVNQAWRAEIQTGGPWPATYLSLRCRPGPSGTENLSPDMVPSLTSPAICDETYPGGTPPTHAHRAHTYTVQERQRAGRGVGVSTCRRVRSVQWHSAPAAPRADPGAVRRAGSDSRPPPASLSYTAASLIWSLVRSASTFCSSWSTRSTTRPAAAPRDRGSTARCPPPHRRYRTRTWPIDLADVTIGGGDRIPGQVGALP
jgi:hypothetical protein